MAQHQLPTALAKGRVGGLSRTSGQGNKLTRESALLVLSALRRGSTRTAAYSLAGVSKDTFLRWMDHRRVPEGVILPDLYDPDNAPMTDWSGIPFDEAVTRAQQEASDFLARRIMAASSEGYRETYHYGRNGALLRTVKEFDWKAAAWLLEHNPEFRKEWSAPKQIEMSGPDGRPIRTEGVQIVTWQPDAEWLANYASALAEVETDAINVTPGQSPLIEAGDAEDITDPA